MSMGSAVVAVDQCSASLLWNPAGLSRLSCTELGLHHNTGLADTFQETVIFGDWSQVRVPFWKTLQLRSTDVGAGTFEKDQTMVRGIMYADISIDHLESFSIGTTAA